MTQNERRIELVGHARRLVDQRIVDASSVTINEFAGTVRNRYSGELLHYESGEDPPAPALWPWPVRIRT